MRKFRKKPAVVEAFQTDKELVIHTLEGDMKADVGDWIITGVHGEQYPASQISLRRLTNRFDLYHFACLVQFAGQTSTGCFPRI